MKMFFHYTEIKSKFSSLFLQYGEVFILLHSGFPGFDARKKTNTCFTSRIFSENGRRSVPTMLVAESLLKNRII